MLLSLITFLILSLFPHQSISLFLLAVWLRPFLSLHLFQLLG